MNFSTQIPGSLLLACFVACSGSTTSIAIPTVSSEQFQFEIQANWAMVGTGNILPIRHRLVNNSPISVCVGGYHVFIVGGRPAQSRIVNDAHCDIPLAVVPPGGAIEWLIDWNTNPNCIAANEAPSGFAESLPKMICGNRVTLQSEISIYRISGGLPQWEGMRLASTAQNLRLNPPNP